MVNDFVTHRKDSSSMTVRAPAVAGLFYEENPARLQQHVAGLLDQVTGDARPTPRALIVPHAGYVYSGLTAARAYARLRPLRDRIRRVALFGPAHRVYLQGMAIPSVDTFSTPLGDIPLDRAALQQIIDLPAVTVSDEAHREEHSLEVQLPFLQAVLADFRLVPVVVGRCDPSAVAAVMDALWQEPDTLLLVSTDLSHFHPYGEARQLDSLTCERLLARNNTLTGEEACGAQALNGLMSTARGRSLDMELISMCNSGDTAGDRNRVVGYGAFALH